MQVSDEVGPDASRWKATFYYMVGIQFVMSMALTVINPLLPLYLPTIGIAGGRDILLWTGLLTSANLFAAAAASPVWGLLADRYGRKAMVIRSSAAIAVFTALMAMVGNVWWLLAVRALMGAFSGFAAAATTLVAGRAPHHRLGYALGWLASAQMAGTFFGPLIGGALSDAFGSYRIAFLWTSALSLIALALIWRFVPDDDVADKHGRWAPSPPSRRWRVVSAAFPFFVLLLIAQIALRSVQPVITMFVALLVPNARNLATLAGMAFAVAGLSDLLGSPLLGKRSDRAGYRRILAISLIGSALFTAPQAWAGSYWVFLAERFGTGLFISSVIPTAQALLARHTEPRERGLMYGIGASATFLGGGLGPLMGASVAALFGIRSVFFATSALLLLACLWVGWRLPDGEPRASPATP